MTKKQETEEDADGERSPCPWIGSISTEDGHPTEGTFRSHAILSKFHCNLSYKMRKHFKFNMETQKAQGSLNNSEQ